MVDEYRIALGLLFIGFGIVFAQNLWIYFTACDFQANTNHRLNENSRLIKFLVDRNAEDRKLIGHLTRRVEELESKFVTTSMRIEGVDIPDGEWSSADWLEKFPPVTRCAKAMNNEY